MTQTVNILWTGGWDSTFQLVRSLVVDKVEVQPFYIIDESRRSAGMEILTMKRIKQALRTEFPECAGSLLPVKFVALSDVSDNEDITGLFRNVFKRRAIGVQYDWLGRFCHQFGVSDLQLCIHEDDHAHEVVRDIVENKNGGLEGYRVSPEYAGTDEGELFKYYSFPILKLTKRDMEKISRDSHFNSIMNLTWFCHAPKNGKPCGTCRPCRSTLEEGFGWRIPYSRRLQGTIVHNFLRPVKRKLQRAVQGSSWMGT